MGSNVKEMNSEEIRRRIVELGFDGDEARFAEFCATLTEGLPPGTGVALRGSVVTDERWADGRPFDADGPGTSDLDVALIGSAVMTFWDSDAYYIPLLHTKPLGDKDPNIAPGLNPLRAALQEMVGRPVNFQATANLVLFARDVFMGQPYFVVIEREETEEAEEEEAGEGSAPPALPHLGAADGLVEAAQL